MRDPSAAEQIATTRQETTKLAVVGDAEGLRALADRLPEAAYDRHRALALALAVEGKGDQAVEELSGAGAQLQDSSTVAADLAELRLLSGDPKAAVAALAHGLSAPERPRRRALAGVLAGAGAAAGAATSRLRIERPLDDRVRVAAGAASLVAAVAALLLLPRTLDDENGGRTATQLARPDKPRPSVVRVASPPAQARGEPRLRARDVEAERGLLGGLGGLIASGLPLAAPFGEAASEPRSPRAPRPAAPTRPGAPPTTPPATSEPPAAATPSPSPAPVESQPAPASPAQPTRASSQAPTAGGGGQSTKSKPAKNAKQPKKEKKKDSAAPAPASANNGSAVSSQVPQGPPEHAAEQHGGPPGQEKKEANDERGGDKDKDKGEKEKGPKK